MVSGSADMTVRAWQASDEKLLKILNGFNQWIVKVLLQHSSQHSIEKFQKEHILLVMSTDSITLYSWQEESSIQDIVLQYQIPLKAADCFYLENVSFTPGLQLFGNQIAFVRQVAMFDTHTVGDADLVIIDANTGQLKKSIHINQKIRKLLAVGEKYALILLPYVGPNYQNLAIVDLHQRKIVGGSTVPHSTANNPEFTHIDIGQNKTWLNGFQSEGNQDLLVAMATVEKSLHLVNWNL